MTWALTATAVHRRSYAAGLERQVAAIGFIITPLPPVLDLTDFKRDLSELTDRLGDAQDCL
ncbi:MAG: hypothetical protein NTV57_00795 [Cyanobacteria bacterium]|nr:hypothetical protein [Cyanobacteriota bacterium]